MFDFDSNQNGITIVMFMLYFQCFNASSYGVGFGREPPSNGKSLVHYNPNGEVNFVKSAQHRTVELKYIY